MNDETLAWTMKVNEETLTLAWILVIAAGLNWALGNRSAFGKKLILRSGNLWRITRWAGLTLFLLAVIVQKQMEGGSFFPLLAFFGAFVMAIGTTRKAVGTYVAGRKEQCAEQDKDDQGASALESKP